MYTVQTNNALAVPHCTIADFTPVHMAYSESEVSSKFTPYKSFRVD